MFDLLSYFSTYLVQAVGLFIAYVFAGVFIYLILKQFYSKKITFALLAVFLGASLYFYVPVGLPNAFEYPFFS